MVIFDNRHPIRTGRAWVSTKLLTPVIRTFRLYGINCYLDDIHKTIC